MASWTFRAPGRWMSRHPEAQIAGYLADLAAASTPSDLRSHVRSPRGKPRSRKWAVTRPPPSERDRERVSRMIDGGMTFGQVENAIEHFDLPDYQKSALWMMAWSQLDPHDQERVADDAYA
jgi:hypothetical protein